MACSTSVVKRIFIAQVGYITVTWLTFQLAKGLLLVRGLSWLGWVGLGWVGLGWVGLGWVGLGWVGLG